MSTTSSTRDVSRARSTTFDASATDASATDASASLTPRTDAPALGPVLLATSGHAASDAAFVAARLVADRMRTTVQVLSVVEPYPVVGMDAMAMVPAAIGTAQRDAMAASLRARLEALPFDTTSWTATVRIGGTARTIAQMAGECDASLIVMGAGQHRLRERIFGGERTLQVLHLTDRPVLAVSSEFGALPRTTVVATDFSPASVRAARAALLVTATDGRLVLVHVRPGVDLPLAVAGGGSLASGMSKEEFDALVARWGLQAATRTATLFTNLLDELRPHTPRGVTIETRTLRGTVVEELLRVADEVGAELIVSGSQTHGAFERAILGSVAKDLMRSGGRAVLCAPPPDAAEAARVELRLRGTSTITQADDWAPVLAAFSRRNAGRRARLEVDDPTIGAQVQLSGFAFLGAVGDIHARRVELSFGDAADGTRHVTRSIPHASDVALHDAPDGRSVALRVLTRRSQTLLTFLD
jgi:nucleotide-binding universal stress UspA family protein